MDQISKAAEFIADLRFTLHQEPEIPETFRPETLAAGYAVQAKVVDRLLQKYGGCATGYKVACTNKLAQELLGTDTPFYGRLLSPFMYQSPARVNPQDFSMRLIEAEFSFQLAENLSREGAPYNRESVAEAVAAILPSIELVDTRYTAWTEVPLPSLIADNGCNSGWVRETPPRRGARLTLPPTRSASGSTVLRNSAAQALRFWATL